MYTQIHRDTYCYTRKKSPTKVYEGRRDCNVIAVQTYCIIPVGQYQPRLETAVRCAIAPPPLPPHVRSPAREPYSAQQMRTRAGIIS
jgi:hypothetical protein